MTDNPPTTPFTTPVPTPGRDADTQLTEVIQRVAGANPTASATPLAGQTASTPTHATTGTPAAPAQTVAPAAPAATAAGFPPVVAPAAPPTADADAAAGKDAPPQRIALVVVVGMSLLAVAFIVMIFVNVSSASINALAVIAAPIAAMVAAYYGITLSIQQVKNERAEKERAVARADAADAASRETEVWAAQMESGLRVAVAKLNAAGVNTSEVTKAAGTPDGFF